MKGITMKLKLKQDRIMVQEVPPTRYGLPYVVEINENQAQIKVGKVIAVGPGRINASGKLEPVNLKEGDKIMYAGYAGMKVKLDSEEFLLMSEWDVFAVFE